MKKRKSINPNGDYMGEMSLEARKYRFVDKSKLTEKEFKNIVEVSNRKSVYATWLSKMVIDKIIDSEDIYKFKEYFSIFNKNKKLYPNSDINQYRTFYDVSEFISKTQEIRDKEIEVVGGVGRGSIGKGLVTANEVRKLESVGIVLLGLQDGYQVFKIPQNVNNNKEGWKLYKDILGRCAGRENGAKIDLCTMASDESFDKYLKDGPYYVMFNLNDPKSPYQFHYESGQFMDKNNKSIA
jgi:cytochrome c-type biogenesis protein CcmE